MSLLDRTMDAIREVKGLPQQKRAAVFHTPSEIGAPRCGACGSSNCADWAKSVYCRDCQASTPKLASGLSFKEADLTTPHIQNKWW